MASRVTGPVRVALAAALVVVLAGVAAVAAAGPGGWDHLGEGATPGSYSLDGTVSSLHVAAPDSLFVGGSFTSAGGNGAAGRLARWDGFAWNAVGSPALTGSVLAIATHAGKVFAGGTFTNAGGNADADFLAVWDGVSWQPFCSPSPAFGGTVSALQVIGSTLYVGGSFQNGAGIAAADYLLACDLDTGVASSTVNADGDFTGSIDGLARDDAGRLYIAGGFSNLDQIAAADNVASYDGSWHALGAGPAAGGGAVSGRARSIASDGTNVYVGTDALDVAGIPQADHIARWNGTAWSALGANTAGTDGWLPTTATLNAIAVAGADVFVTGSFQNADGNVLADHVAGFQGGVWGSLGSDGAGNGPWVGNGLALAIFGGQLVAGGTFTSAGGDSQARFVTRYVQPVAPTPTPTPTPSPPPTPTPTPAPLPFDGTPRLPTPPTVTISSPVANAFFNQPEQILVSGTVSAPGGLAQFCVAANTTALPASCIDAAAVQANGTFSNVRVLADTRPGSNTLTAYAVDARGQERHASVSVDLPNGVDVRTTSMELNQSIQQFALPLNFGAPVAYSGVKLVQGATTIVRVYANAFATGRAPGLPVPNVPALLAGSRNGTALPGSPLSPESGPASLPAGPLQVRYEEINDPNSGYTFTLPLSWTAGGPIQLRAMVNPPTSASAVPEAGTANNLFTLTHVAFEHREPHIISPVKIVYTDPETGTQTTPPDADAAFAALRNIVPLGDDQLVVLPYRGVINVSNLFALTEGTATKTKDRQTGIWDRVVEWEAGHNELGLTMGIVKGYSSDAAKGMELPFPFAGCYIGCVNVSGPRVEAIAYGNTDRPLTSVAHEFLHALNYWHAGHRCASGFSTDFPYVHWAPDDQGFIQGMGLNRQANPALRPGTYERIIPSLVADPPLVNQRTAYYDIMSYCSGGSDDHTWISTRGWNSFGSGPFPIGLPEPSTDHRRSPAPARSAQAGAKTLRVVASIEADGSAKIIRVRPGATGAGPVSDVTSPYRFVVRDSAGGIVSRTGAKAEAKHIDYDAGNVGAALAADVGAVGAQTIELTHFDKVIATEARSAHPPTVKLLSPAAGSTISSTSSTRVRWQATDADGDPLEVTVSYSDDGGRTFNNLALGGLAGRTEVPASLFGKASNGRVRVAVNDGFDETVALSGRLRAAGAPPVVRIVKPVKGQRVRADATLALLGEAFDTAGKTLKGNRLTWFDGRRRVGRGASLTMIGMAAGTHHLSLQARGSNGKTSRATITVKVTGVKPDLIITPPKSLKRSARKVTLRVASTVPGVLRAGGRSFGVDRKVRAISIPVKPGSKPLSLRLVIRGGGGRMAYTVKLARR